MVLVKRRLVRWWEFRLSSLHSIQSAPRTYTGSVVHKKTKVVFLYDSLNQDKGSTVLRSKQLFEVVSANPDFETMRSSSATGIRNSIVVLDKYTSLFLPIEDLVQLRRDQNFIISDPVDDIINPYRLNFFDGLMAASVKQYAHFKQQHPNKHLGYVFHHCDTRIAPPTGTQRPAPAYFGELKNMFRFEGDQDLVEIFGINTSLQNLSWMEAISLCSLHYAIRPPASTGHIYKPFTKGIVAARVQANIIVHKDDGDALHHLTTEYPYLLKDVLTPAAAKDAVKFAIESYNGPEWKRGLEIMSRLREETSLEKLQKDFWAYIKRI